MSVRPGMEYKPLPPIMPISACCKRESPSSGVNLIIKEAKKLNRSTDLGIRIGRGVRLLERIGQFSGPLHELRWWQSFSHYKVFQSVCRFQSFLQKSDGNFNRSYLMRP